MIFIRGSRPVKEVNPKLMVHGTYIYVFTAEEIERDDLELHGWSPEGAAFYAVRERRI